jgi:hypothetical protein
MTLGIYWFGYWEDKAKPTNPLHHKQVEQPWQWPGGSSITWLNQPSLSCLLQHLHQAKTTCQFSQHEFLFFCTGTLVCKPSYWYLLRKYYDFEHFAWIEKLQLNLTSVFSLLNFRSVFISKLRSSMLYPKKNTTEYWFYVLEPKFPCQLFDGQKDTRRT